MEDEDEYIPNPPKKLVKNLIREVGKGNMVLDVGCGNGYYTKMFVDGNTVYGMDLDDHKIPNISFIEGDAEDSTNYPKTKFDVVLCISVIEHCKKPQKILKNIHDVLKDDGKLVLITPNYGYWFNRLKFIFGKPIQKYNDPHIRLFVHKELKKLVVSTGFRIKEIKSNLGLLGKIYPPLFSGDFMYILKKL